MDPITVITGADLGMLLADIQNPNYVYKIRIWQAPDGSAVKIKINEGIWSPPIGMTDV